ncbi:unnamed protein product [Choristocarpus tenellus]
MEKRLERGEYNDRRRGLTEFIDDLEWIAFNCRTYNGRWPLVVAQAFSCVLVSLTVISTLCRQWS